PHVYGEYNLHTVGSRKSDGHNKKLNEDMLKEKKEENFLQEHRSTPSLPFCINGLFYFPHVYGEYKSSTSCLDDLGLHTVGSRKSDGHNKKLNEDMLKEKRRIFGDLGVKRNIIVANNSFKTIFLLIMEEWIVHVVSLVAWTFGITRVTGTQNYINIHVTVGSKIQF
ncbi:hypothetical protein ACJX0J_021652, partial [Zea mays]